MINRLIRLMINQLIRLFNYVNSIKRLKRIKKLLSGLSKHYIYVLCVLFLYLEGTMSQQNHTQH